MGLIRRAGEFKQGAKWHPEERQYFATNLFFENSTRTHKSFEVAEKKLGLEVIEFEENIDVLLGAILPPV
jgi:aspartate carbamoyltransferase catalytic subunit